MGLEVVEAGHGAAQSFEVALERHLVDASHHRAHLASGASGVEQLAALASTVPPLQVPNPRVTLTRRTCSSTCESRALRETAIAGPNLVGVRVGVRVRVRVGVRVRVRVGVRVRVRVRVRVGLRVRVSVGLRVGLRVGARVRVRVPWRGRTGRRRRRGSRSPWWRRRRAGREIRRRRGRGSYHRSIPGEG